MNNDRDAIAGKPYSPYEHDLGTKRSDKEREATLTTAQDGDRKSRNRQGEPCDHIASLIDPQVDDTFDAAIAHHEQTLGRKLTDNERYQIAVDVCADHDRRITAHNQSQ